MMKPCGIFLCLSVLSGAISAEQTDSCAGLEAAALAQCRSYEQTLRQQERLEQLMEQQQERQNQLDQQQREVRQQLEDMRLQNQSLRRQLERDAGDQRARTVAMSSTESSKNSDLTSWKADNLWFGSDYARTQFAMRYIKQLQQERPDLTGRELLDAVSAKTSETFGAKR